jgi:nucleoside-diphosphate-sugar epimerase
MGELIVVGDIHGTTDWFRALGDATAVVHLANRAHVMREKAEDPFALYHKVNVQGTRRLAEQAVAAGVRNFVYLSSVKVLGEATQSEPFDDKSLPNPQDPYAHSKWQAEQTLGSIASASGMQTTILRPPLVYGAGVGANFLWLMKWIARGIPLPLSAVCNHRSMIYVGNLVDSVRVCMEDPRAAGKSYLVSDGPAVSTAQLVQQLAVALGVPNRSWPVPPRLLQAFASASGRGGAVRRLTESLVVNDFTIRQETGWTPPHLLNDGLQQTADWFRGGKIGGQESLWTTD